MKTVSPFVSFVSSIMRYALVALTVLASGVMTHLSVQSAGHATTAAKPTIVLVHGAWADASGWYDVTVALQARGYKVVAVQNSLFSYAKDIETTKRVLDAQQGPIVMVGHSYGGAVVTAAAAGNPNVKSLVYVAAFAPDSNEAVGALLQRYPDLGLGKALAPDAAGFLYIDAAKYPDVFANGLPPTQARAASHSPSRRPGRPCRRGTSSRRRIAQSIRSSSASWRSGCMRA